MISSIASIFNGLFAGSDSLSKEEFLSLAKRDRLSTYLPWLSYNKRQGNFLQMDNTLAYMWEITPLVYFGPKQVKELNSLIRQSYPSDTVMQFILYPDENIEPLLQSYVSHKQGLDDIGEKAIESIVSMFRDGAKGLPKLKGMPIRNFRSFVVIKSREDLSEAIPLIEESLEGIGLSPRRLTDETLISFQSSFLNRKPKGNKKFIDRNESHFKVRHKALRDHVVDRETSIDFSKSYIDINGQLAAILTPSDMPEKINPLQANNLIGGLMGRSDDNRQLLFPFYYSLNIVFSDVDEEIGSKVASTMKQSRFGSYVHEISKRISECNSYRANVANKRKYIKIIPTLMVFADNEESLIRNIAKTKTVWGNSETGSFELQQEHTLNAPLFIASLPGGLYNQYNNIQTLNRHFYATSEVAACLLPIQGDYFGNGKYGSIFVGRKGQLIGFDVFSPQSNNHNFLVTAESGGGKSFLLNTLLRDQFYEKNKVRIVDIGGSYRKSTLINKGKFIDFSLKNNQCINPSDFVVAWDENGEPDKEDLLGNLTAAALVYQAMVYSKSRINMPEHESQLIKDATRWVYNTGRGLEGVDAIREYLNNYAEITKDTEDYLESNIKTAKKMAYNLKDFGSNGTYGHLFVGESTVKVSQDNFVVMELEEISADPELFYVVLLQMMNEITQDLYLSSRGQKRFILIEEAATLLKKHGRSDLSILGEMVKEGYRRARKYRGSLGVVFQSILDTKLMGDVGEVILGNAAYKLMLTSKGDQYTKASGEKIINYKDFGLDLLNSLVNNKPNYSEVFLDTPQGKGVARLVVDDFSYLLGTTEGHEVERFEEALKRGATPMEALYAIRAA